MNDKPVNDKPVNDKAMNDKAGSYPPSFYHATAHFLGSQPVLEGDRGSDVAIIGGGYTGLSAALHLAEAGFSVCLLEAHRVGWGASGRNGGQLATSQRQTLIEMEQSLGVDYARALWELGLEANSGTKQLIRKHAIQCDLKPGLLYADHRASHARDSAFYADYLFKTCGYEGITYVDSRKIKDLLGTKSYFGGTFHHDGAHLHPLNYALGLARAALLSGVIIYEKSPVVQIEKTGNYKKLYTPRGALKAKSVIFATNGYLGNFPGDSAGRINRYVMPINNFIVATEPLCEHLAHDLIRGSFAVADSRFIVFYYRKSIENRLIFGGGETYSYKFPRCIKTLVGKNMRKIYPQLANSEIDYAWGGTLAITRNRWPYVREIDKGIWAACGYSGSGVGMATFCGKLLAEAVGIGLERFDLMAGLPARAFPGGKRMRGPCLSLAMLYYALRDAL